MSVFPDWEKYAVVQKRKSSCIAAGYQMILRAKGITGIAYNTFQDDFDLGKDNNFKVVAEAIKKRYLHIDFKSEVFMKGADKIYFIEKYNNKQEPVLVSISKKGLYDISKEGRLYLKIIRDDRTEGGVAGIPLNQTERCHIMPIVDSTDKELFLLNGVKNDGTKEIFKILKEDLIYIHDHYNGGNDVAYLNKI